MGGEYLVKYKLPVFHKTQNEHKFVNKYYSLIDVSSISRIMYSLEYYHLHKQKQ